MNHSSINSSDTVCVLKKYRIHAYSILITSCAPINKFTLYAISHEPLITFTDLTDLAHIAGILIYISGVGGD
jgi:hypothetical protein